MLDKETRTLAARIEVPNKDGRLKPEMFANAAIALSRKAKVLVVPNEAVVLMQGAPTAFVEGKDGFEARAVETGERGASGVVVKSGLKPGDLAIISGGYALKARMQKSQLGAGHAH